MGIYEVSWVILTLTCLCIATIEDIKNRSIPDKIWLVQIIGGLLLLIFWMNSNISTESKLLAIINITIAFIFAYIFFIVGSFGGGDSKAIIAISISSPVAIADNLSEVEIHFPSIVYILANMMVGLIFFTIILLVLNLYQIKRFGPLFGETSGSLLSKLNVLLSSRRIAASQVENLRHEDPAEIFDGIRWKLYTPIFTEPMEDEEFEKVEREVREKATTDVRETSRSYLWTRPQPPGLLFMTAGYVYWVFLGSPLAYFLKFL